jgi:hypothetical protein
MTENRKQIPGFRCRKADDRKQITEDRFLVSGVGVQVSGQRLA